MEVGTIVESNKKYIGLDNKFVGEISYKMEDELNNSVYNEVKTNVGYYFFYIMDILFNRNHIDRVISNLYIGNVYTALNINILTQNNINAVMNCSKDIPFIEDDSIKRTFRLSIEDDERTESMKIMSANIDCCVDFVRECILNNLNVFVHCRAGVQRSASVVIAYLMKYRGLKLIEATHYLKTIRPCIFEPNAHFIKPLEEYERLISKQTSRSSQ